MASFIAPRTASTAAMALTLVISATTETLLMISALIILSFVRLRAEQASCRERDAIIGALPVAVKGVPDVSHLESDTYTDPTWATAALHDRFLPWCQRSSKGDPSRRGRW